MLDVPKPLWRATMMRTRERISSSKASYKLLKAHPPTKSLRKVFFSATLKTFESRTARMTSLYSCTAGFLSALSSCIVKQRQLYWLMLSSWRTRFLLLSKYRKYPRAPAYPVLPLLR